MNPRTLFRWSLLGLWVLALLAVPSALKAQTCERIVKADVVAFDQVFFWNRLGAVQPQGMIFALRRDVVPIDASLGLVPGNVMLREDKRPRPLVLRMNVGDCLRITFENLLNPTPVDEEQPHTRTASIHVIGLELVESISDDGSFVGQNPSSLVGPGESAIYTLHARREGQHVLYSAAATTGGEGDGGSLNAGLFGAVNVEPAGSTWFRSQVTAVDLQLATKKDSSGHPIFTPSGHPVIDYEAVYPEDHPRAGTPILRMLDPNLQIVHSDLNAIIAGFPSTTYRKNPVYPNRNRPFREFTVLYHDEIGAVQAFPIFEDPVFEHTTHSGRDAFALNYGTGGIGAEILANRFAVGPMWDCTECKYEEFFLSSWTVADPAMVVDVPANAPCTIEDVRNATGCTPEPGPKATQAFFPDDPSNVHHSYLQDHVKFRILHGGSKEHHIHHQHTHQWLFSPDSDNSTYLDSQALGPGASFTLEMVHHGSGNRNQAVGDSIFHCHFYPHFAQGMWALWRVHDVFESGTALDAAGRPAPGSRALPDGEIAAGTPIPAVVPIPGLPMAPLPGAKVSISHGQVQIEGDGNPGYPFFIPGIAGHRPPHPPLDTIHDGGLKRHVIAGGEAFHVETRLDFTKDLEVVEAIELPETGLPVEEVAMKFHAQRLHPTCLPDGTCDEAVSPGSGKRVNFIANGLPPVPGAPYADPCIDDAGKAIGNPRLYKAANIQLDVILNKKGWHFPQQRMVSLWDDVDDFKFGKKPPEPLFFRANSIDCITFELTNLVPNVYELDDFQVRTPTDILGQHIHLVKFDVTASDGAANGWNYEDGSFSPDEVRERMRAIRAFHNCTGDEVSGGDSRDGTFECPVAVAHPFFGPGPDENGDGISDWLGAQTTVQRWFADDVLNLNGVDRTLRTVFTHDHFGPSTHQQAALYAGLVIEPQGSTWRHPETGETFGGRFDGGPTSWRADIHTADPKDSYREFLLNFGDFQLAYYRNNRGFPDPANAVNPPGRKEVDLPFLVERPDRCPGGVPPPCPEMISADDVGTMSVNYRNEPIATRVFDPATGKQADGQAGDLAFAFSSNVQRADPDLNVQPTFYDPLTPGLEGGDPFTPLMQAYEHDPVQIRILVGAHEEGHNFSVNGIKWLFEPSDPNSGYRNSQMMGISEHFEFVIPQLVKNPLKDRVDYLWAAGASVDDLWNGLWGLLRVYRGKQPILQTLPNNPDGGKTILDSEKGKFDGVCPKDAPVRKYSVTAVTAQQALPDGTLIYNSRSGKNNEGPLHDPTAILYVRTEDLDANGQLKAGVPIEPLILRANAGECIYVELVNKLPSPVPDLDGFSTLPMLIDHFNANQIRPSSYVGLHPQLVLLDVSRSDGNNVGTNNTQTPKPGTKVTYQWYAGDLFVNDDGTVTVTPIEFGATNLIPADRIKQTNKGAIGALIIEPPDASWEEDANTRASAIVKFPVSSTSTAGFREFVLLFQNDLNLRFGDGSPIPNLADAGDPEDSGQKAINYRTEPMWFRMGFAPDTPLETTRTFDFTKVLSNEQVGGDPQTPVFKAKAGAPVRFRVLHPGGHQRNNVFAIHGHVWEQEPYQKASTRLGPNPLSLWEGARMGHGPTNHFDILLRHGAGGRFKVPGDYLYRDFQSFQFDAGIWGIFRVVP